MMETVKRFCRTTLVLLCVMAPLASGCVRTDNGVAIRSDEAATTVTPSPQRPTQPSEDAGPAAPGIVATSRAPIPPNTVTCSQPVESGRGGRRTGIGPGGPEGSPSPFPTAGRPRRAPATSASAWQVLTACSATVTIAQTQLDPADAFTEYADKVMAVSAVSSVSVLPAELCGYSGQKLMGAWSDNPQQSVEFLDRIVHIWTNTERLSGRRPRAGARRNRRFRRRLNGAD